MQPGQPSKKGSFQAVASPCSAPRFRSFWPKLTSEEKVGASILIKACEAPFRQIVLNTGYDPSVMLQEVLGQEKSVGFNAITEKVEDLLKCGVIDPVKVVKASLSHAVSMAGIVLPLRSSHRRRETLTISPPARGHVMNTRPLRAGIVSWAKFRTRPQHCFEKTRAVRPGFPR